MRARRLVLAVGLLLAAGCGDSAIDRAATSDQATVDDQATIEEQAVDAPEATASSSITTSSTTTSTTATSSTAAVATLEQLVADAIDGEDGGAVVLRRRGTTVETVAVGPADATGRALTADTPLRVGSISKPFVAVMIMQLVDEGSVELDAAVSTWLPDTDVGADRTVRQLLGHRSGLANYTDRPDARGQLLAGLDDRGRVDTPDDVLALVADVEHDAPGPFAYSNTNYILLGQIIESVDGVDLDTALQRRIAEPLGLQDTSFSLPGNPDSDDLASPWWDPFLAGEPETEYTFISSGAWAAGALVSTAPDLLRFLDGLADGELVSEASLGEMTDFGDAGDDYGLGLFPLSVGDGGSGYGHNGAIPGYHSTMGLAPESGDALVVLTNGATIVADQLAAQILRPSG